MFDPKDPSRPENPDETPRPEDTPSWEPEGQATPPSAGQQAAPPPPQMGGNQPRPQAPPPPYQGSQVQPGPQGPTAGAPRPHGAPPMGYAPPPGGYGPPPPGYGPPQPPFGPAPPFGGPPPKVKRSSAPLIIGLAVLFVVGLFVLISFVASISMSGRTSGMPSFGMGPRIALLEVNGVIGEGPGYGANTEQLTQLVRRWKEDNNIQGMVIRINSPGGAVSATHDLYQAISEFSDEKPVYANMGDVAASGGYYLAMAADEIYVNEGTLTGSVGVILNLWGYEGLVDKIGLEPRPITSGEYKDMGSGTRPLRPDEVELFDDLIESVFDQFFQIVHDSRAEAVRELLATERDVPLGDITTEEIEQHIRNYTDGRIFSGRQAVDYGMADQAGTLHDTITAMQEQLGIEGRPRLTRTPQPPRGLFGLVNQKAAQMQTQTPGTVTMEYRFSL